MAEGYVYFIRSDVNGLIRIGWSAVHPDARIRRLRATCPTPLVPIAFRSGTRKDENVLHCRFAEHHSHGEWFYPTTEIENEAKSGAIDWPDPANKFRRRLGRYGRLPLQQWAGMTYITIKGITQTALQWHLDRSYIRLSQIRYRAQRGLELFDYSEKDDPKMVVHPYGWKPETNLQPAD